MNTALRNLSRWHGVKVPRLWNQLPPDIRDAPSIYAFKSRLKTHLYNLAFPPHYLSDLSTTAFVCVWMSGFYVFYLNFILMLFVLFCLHVCLLNALCTALWSVQTVINALL